MEEFLSTIRHESGDPAIAEKLVLFVERLMGGAALDRAAREASLDLAVASRFLESVRGQLAAAIPKGKAAAPKAKPRKSAKKKSATGRLIAFTRWRVQGQSGRGLLCGDFVR